MKRILLLALALMLTAFACAEAQHTVEYYFENYCESCDPAADYADEFRKLTGLELSECEYSAYNAVTEAGRAALDAAMEKHGLESAGLPMVIVDGKVYQGSNAMRTELAEMSMSWGGSLDTTVVYLYTPGCESCAEAEAAVEALPQSIEAKRGDVTFTSNVVVVKLDATKDPAAAQALFERYEVADDRRITPSVFLPGHALNGAERIGKYLNSLVAAGQAVGAVEIAEAEAPAPTGSVWTALAAGVVAGFNGCALSMLLMFCSILLSKGRSMLLYGGVFLASKLTCYLLIGFALLQVMQRLNPTYLVPAARWILTLLGGGLAALNLWDAAAARKGDLGRMRNQLPTGLRGKLHRAIRFATGQKVLLPACILLGAVVAAGEFLCAGQIYLASLLQTVQTGNSLQGTLSLILYCGGFVLPSAVILLLIARGSSADRIARFMAKHLALVKLLTAVMMIALVLAAWLLV